MAPLAWKVSARLASVCEDTPGFARAAHLRFIPQTRVPRVRHASASDRARAETARLEPCWSAGGAGGAGGPAAPTQGARAPGPPRAAARTHGCRRARARWAATACSRRC